MTLSVKHVTSAEAGSSSSATNRLQNGCLEAVPRCNIMERHLWIVSSARSNVKHNRTHLKAPVLLPSELDG